VPIEAEARAARIGLWQGTFQLPEEWRADRGINVRRP
jgi:endonuclease YncB( thermonuclease family)